MLFYFNFKKVLAAVAIVLVPIILFNLEASLRIASRPFLEVSYAVQTALNFVSNGVGDTSSRYLNLISIKKNNKALLKEVSKLKMSSAAYQEIRLENERLKKLLEIKARSPMSLLASTVVSEDLISENQTLTIDQGLKKGVRDQMGVLGLNGVIGTVLKTSSKRAQVLILTDRFFVVEGLIQRSREKLIIEGTGDVLITARHIRTSIDIQIGDLLVTSGGDGSFPKGLPIGIVQDIRVSNAGITKTAYIKPLADLFNAEELFVITQPGEIQE
jgi:rod shape-determining protein MreC